MESLQIAEWKLETQSADWWNRKSSIFWFLLAHCFHWIQVAVAYAAWVAALFWVVVYHTYKGHVQFVLIVFPCTWTHRDLEAYTHSWRTVDSVPRRMYTDQITFAGNFTVFLGYLGVHRCQIRTSILALSTYCVSGTRKTANEMNKNPGPVGADMLWKKIKQGRTGVL